MAEQKESLTTNTAEKELPLCVDLDGTLIATDTLHEAFLILLKSKPWIIFLLPFWLLKGRYYFKEKIYSSSVPDFSTFPFNREVLKFVKSEAEKGRKIVLATATFESLAKRAAEQIGIFSEVYGSKDSINLKSKNKRDKLVLLFGEKGFDYIGDSNSDLEVFASARFSYLVNPSKSLQSKAESTSNVKMIFSEKYNIFKLVIKQIRVYQWVKNILIFLPMLMAHIISQVNLFQNTTFAFFAFSFLASSVYVLNDLLDLESDRKHPRKKNRPLASGKLPILLGLIMAPMLFLMGFGISLFFLHPIFTATLAVYFALTTAYSFALKKIYILDIILLASLYTIRLIAGAAATQVAISPWLLGFSMFLFMSLATVKRYTELLVMKQNNREKTSGRGYYTDDIELLLAAGVGSGLISVMVFALYANSKETLALYSNPHLLYGAAPLLLYWILRIWFKAHRGEMNDDPIVFTGKDPASYFIGLLIVILVIGAAL